MAPDSATPAIVFKILRTEEWATFKERGTFEGSPDDLRDGFIHLSTEAQLDGTLAKHFIGAKTVVLAAVRTAGLPIKMEESRDNLQFPHLYGTLRLQDLISYEERKLK
jgi:uncharacterized protein (DUF952 family)